MGNSDETKELIIKETIKLIQQQNGDVEQITIRKIAGNTGIGIGLINHYFGSKSALMEICVQKVISDVIASFKPDLEENTSRNKRLTQVACQVMDFQMANQEISKMSILSDMKNPKKDDNTTAAIRGFFTSMTTLDPPQKGMELAFMLTAILQESFLRRNVLKETIGVDFYVKSDRDAYVARIVNQLMGSAGD